MSKELDEKVARLVMGWEKSKPWDDGGPLPPSVKWVEPGKERTHEYMWNRPSVGWSPSGDWDGKYGFSMCASWAVVRKVGGHFTLTNFTTSGGWHALFYPVGCGEVSGKGDNPGEAICNAALCWAEERG